MCETVTKEKIEQEMETVGNCRRAGTGTGDSKKMLFQKKRMLTLKKPSDILDGYRIGGVDKKTLFRKDGKDSCRPFDENGSIAAKLARMRRSIKDFEKEMLREDQVLHELQSSLDFMKKTHEETLISSRETRERIRAVLASVDNRQK